MASRKLLRECTYATLPTPIPIGVFYYCTDTNRFFQGTSTGNKEYTPSSGPAGSNALPLFRTAGPVAIPAIPLLGSANITLTWNATGGSASPFADANYVAVAQITLASGVTVAINAPLLVSQTALAAVFRVTSTVAILASQATLSGIAVHN